MRRIPVILDLLAVGVPLVAGMAGGGSGSRCGYGRGDYGDQSATTADPGASGGGSGGVRIDGFAFAPKAGSARVSQKVTWRDQDASAIHPITALDGSFGSGQLEGDSFSHVFRRAGTFAYHCSIHPSMRGTVKVSG